MGRRGRSVWNAGWTSCFVHVRRRMVAARGHAPALAAGWRTSCSPTWAEELGRSTQATAFGFRCRMMRSDCGEPLCRATDCAHLDRRIGAPAWAGESVSPSPAARCRAWGRRGRYYGAIRLLQSQGAERRAQRAGQRERWLLVAPVRHGFVPQREACAAAHHPRQCALRRSSRRCANPASGFERSRSATRCAHVGNANRLAPAGGNPSASRQRSGQEPGRQGRRGTAPARYEGTARARASARPERMNPSPPRQLLQFGLRFGSPRQQNRLAAAAHDNRTA